jgi:multisubunit Na+/H+ antiporter MnhE subunit
MVFFLMVPVWFLFLAAGIVLCFFHRFRFLSLYFVLVSTGGILVALVLSTFVLWAGPRLLPNAASGARWILIASYFAGIALGGMTGMMAGFIAARSINRLIRWG